MKIKLLGEQLTKFSKNQLLAGSAILFFGSLLGNFSNYLFHLLMGRMLGPIDYGALAALIGVAYLLGIPIATIRLVVVKFVSEFRGKNNLAKVDYFYQWTTKKAFVFGSLFLLGFLAISPLTTAFLHLQSNLFLFFIGLSSFLSLFLYINLATLQGFLFFKRYFLAETSAFIIKLVLSVFLVYLGYQLFGVLSAVVLASAAGFILSFWFVKKALGKKREKNDFDERKVVIYGLPVFLSILAFTSLYTTDIVLARHFLSAQEAGFYAALAVLGKIIFFGSMPISLVMFPMVSERQASGKRYQQLLFQSLGLVLFICLGITSVYFLFPKLMVSILYGSQYLPAVSSLPLFAVFFSLYSLTYLLVNYYLSIKKTGVVFFPGMAALAQIIFISIFHQNLTEMIWVSIVVLGALLISLAGYYLWETKNLSLALRKK